MPAFGSSSAAAGARRPPRIEKRKQSWRSIGVVRSLLRRAFGTSTGILARPVQYGDSSVLLAPRLSVMSFILKCVQDARHRIIYGPLCIRFLFFAVLGAVALIT